MSLVPVLEIGGSHVIAAHVDTLLWSVVPDTIVRLPLDPAAPAHTLIADIAACAATLAPWSGAILRVAIPGPFDYAAGIARFADVGKFESLNGVNLGLALRQGLTPGPPSIDFLNDAAAFVIGEWVAGAARAAGRVVGITLGTGVGSAFLDHGQTVTSGPTVPPQGRVDLLQIHRKPLEETVSTRAIVRSYGPGAAGVKDVSELARAGNHRARSILEKALFQLGVALAPWLQTFRADALVLGGSIARSFDLLEPALVDGLRSGNCDLHPQPATHPDTAALVGAAWQPPPGNRPISAHR